MKTGTKLTSIVLALLMLISVFAAAPLTAGAQIFTSGDYNYEVLDDGTAEITWYRGSDAEIVIPDELDGYTVTSIGDCAFEFSETLIDVTIPDSVTRIGKYAFRECVILLSVTLGNSVISIDYSAFKDCESLESIVIPDSVISIGVDAFRGCMQMTSITISNSVISMGDNAFVGTAYYNNESNWEDDVLYLGKYLVRAKADITGDYTIKNDTVYILPNAFKGCSSLKGVTIPDSVTRIGNSAFNGCSSLTSVTIPDSVISIGKLAFSDCEKIKSVTIPDSVVQIEAFAFGFYTHTDTYSDGGDDVYEWNEYEYLPVDNFEVSGYSGSAADIYAQNNGISFNSLGQSESTPVEFKYTVLGDGTLELTEYLGLRSAETINIPAEIDSHMVTSIGYSTFNYSYCDDYDGELFFDVTPLENITTISLPATINNIDLDTFDEHSKLASINVDRDNENYSSLDGVLYNKDKTKLIKYPLGKADTSFTIPDSVATIDRNAFLGCKLASVTIPDSVTNIDRSAFLGCKLASVTIPDSVKSIGEWAFNGCDNLASITLGNGITSFGNGVFVDTAYYNNESNWEDNVLYIGKYLIRAKVDISGDYNVKNDTICIAHSAFSYSNELTDITIPDSVKTICDEAFYDCTSLENVTLGNGLKSVGGSAFYKCDKLKSVTIPDSVTTLARYAFGHTYDDADDDLRDVLVDGFTIYGYTGSCGEQYANDNNITFVSVGDHTEPTEVTEPTQATEPTQETTPAAKSIKECKVTGIKAKTYNGKAQTQSITVKDGTKTLKKGTDYTISYKNNKNAGTATMTIKGKGNYTGSVKKTFKINKAKNPMKVTAKKTVTANSAKKTTIKKAVKVKKAQGKVTYKTNNKNVTVKNGTITVAKGLTSGKTYKVKITVSAKGNKNYKSGKKVVTVKIKIK